MPRASNFNNEITPSRAKSIRSEKRICCKHTLTAFHPHSGVSCRKRKKMRAWCSLGTAAAEFPPSHTHTFLKKVFHARSSLILHRGSLGDTKEAHLNKKEERFCLLIIGRQRVRLERTVEEIIWRVLALKKCKLHTRGSRHYGRIHLHCYRERAACPKMLQLKIVYIFSCIFLNIHARGLYCSVRRSRGLSSYIY
jgi:hypothetical protein